jgi:hypothetical protein
MSSSLSGQRGPASPAFDQGANRPTQPSASPSDGFQLTTNHLFLLLGILFLGIAFLMMNVYFHGTVTGGSQESVLYPAAFFGMMGLVFLVMSASGVGKKDVVSLSKLTQHQGPHGVKTMTAKEALARLEAEAERARHAPARPLSFFHVRMKPGKWELGHMMYRVFPAGDDFLFIGLHTGSLNPNARRVNRAVGVNAGAIGGLAAGLAAYSAMKAGEEHRARMEVLEGVNDEVLLRQFAGDDPESFVLSMKGVRGVKVGPASYWDRMDWPGEVVGKVQLVHPERGKMVMHLPYEDDAKKGVEEFRRRFGQK